MRIFESKNRLQQKALRADAEPERSTEDERNR